MVKAEATSLCPFPLVLRAACSFLPAEGHGERLQRGSDPVPKSFDEDKNDYAGKPQGGGDGR